MKVRFRRRALYDLDAIRAYISTDNPRAANLMHARLTAACLRLSDFPHIGRPARGQSRELTSVWPYVIGYVVTADHVAILRIVHGARLR